VRVVTDNPGQWKVVTDASTPQVLRLRLTDVPGWKATIDGRPLALQSYAGVLLQARVPPGRHVIELTYWPDTFTLGLILAACSGAGLIIALVVSGRRRRHHAEMARP
jgi:uncharacterized membrane protein YfhO